MIPPGVPIGAVPARRLGSEGLAPGKIRAIAVRALQYGEHEIDLAGVDQLVDASEVATIGHALALLHQLSDGRASLRQLLDALEAILDDEGVEALAPWEYPPGDLVRPRRHEVASALNRLRTLRVI